MPEDLHGHTKTIHGYTVTIYTTPALVRDPYVITVVYNQTRLSMFECDTAVNAKRMFDAICATITDVIMIQAKKT